MHSAHTLGALLSHSRWDATRNLDPNLIEVISEHEQAVVGIDDEIEALMRTVRQLQYKRIQHQEKIKECKGLMTLARRLPPEILASIFEECVRDGWTRTPLTASHVCSEWRKAANIPSVWSHIYVNCDAKDPQGRTRLWLEKSQSSLLRITIDVRNDASHLPGIMVILLERLSQWHIFTINAALLWQVNYVLMLCKRPAPELCALNISILEGIDDVGQMPIGGGNDFGLADSFAPAPRFHTLRINRNTLTSHGMLPPSITDLSIMLPCDRTSTKLSVDKLLHVLRDLPQLRSFSLALLRGQEREFEAPSDETRLVNLPDLTTLVVIGSRDIFTFLPHVLTPALAQLHLRSSLDPLGHPDEQITSCIRRFVEQGPLRVEVLEFHDIDLSLSGFSVCLAGLPRLRELRLHESEISDSIIKALNGSEGYCPLLKRLDLRWCGHVTGRALVGLVKSRLHHVTDHGDSDGAPNSLTTIDHVTVINCAFVGEQDVINLAQNTICQVVMEANDHCRFLGCCQNERYRRRLRYHCAKEIAEINRSNSGKLIL